MTGVRTWPRRCRWARSKGASWRARCTAAASTSRRVTSSSSRRPAASTPTAGTTRPGRRPAADHGPNPPTSRRGLAPARASGGCATTRCASVTERSRPVCRPEREASRMPGVARLGKAVSGYDGQGSEAPGSRADTFRRRVVDLRTTRTIRSAIEIRAPLETVWRVLSDFPSYREWNPHLREVRGRPRQGGRLMVLSQPPGARALALRPRLLIWRPPYEFRWRANFISRHLFSGEPGFRLEAHAEDRVRFVHDETFRGLLVPLYSLVRMAATRRGFAQMNEALRDRAEGIAGAQAAPAEGSLDERP